MPLVCVHNNATSSESGMLSTIAHGLSAGWEDPKCSWATPVECLDYNIITISALTTLLLTLIVIIPTLFKISHVHSTERPFRSKSPFASAHDEESRPLLGSSASNRNTYSTVPSSRSSDVTVQDTSGADADVDEEEWEVVDKSIDSAAYTSFSFKRLALRLFSALALLAGASCAVQLLLLVLMKNADDGVLDVVGYAALTGQWVMSIVIFFASTHTLHPRPFYTTNSNAALVNLERRTQRQRSTLLSLAVYFGFLALITAPMAISAWSSSSTQNTYLFIVLTTHSASALLLVALPVLFRSLLPTANLQRKPLTPGGAIPSPEPDESWWSVLTFEWLNPLMEKGHKASMSLEDLWDLQPADDMRFNLAAYTKLTKTSERCNKSLLFAIFALNIRAFVWMWCVVVATTVLYFSNPYFLRLILLELQKVADAPIQTLDKKAEFEKYLPYFYLFGLFATATVKFLLDNHQTLLSRQIGFRIRNVLSGLIYQKALRRPYITSPPSSSTNSSGKKQEGPASTGAVVNYMSIDAQKIADWAAYIHTPISLLFLISICITSLVLLLGWAALAGLVCMVVFIFAGWPLASVLRKGFYGLKIKRDNRVEATREAFQGIKILKLMAWEPQFFNRIQEKRHEELKHLFTVVFQASLNRVLWYSAPILTTGITLGTYTKIFHHTLDATTAFTALSLFGLLRGPLQQLPDTIVQLLDVWVSFKRVQSFLAEGELECLEGQEVSFEASEDGRGDVLKGEKDGGLWFEEASFMHAHPEKKDGKIVSITTDDNNDHNTFTLQNLNLSFPRGKLTALIGPTAGGKSALLLGLLGEMHRLSGKRSLGTSSGISYVPQTPWLLNGTLKNNILFGYPYNEELYRDVIRACSLIKDLQQLAGGDETEVGEGGVGLSGGQKQRIQIARCLYVALSRGVQDSVVLLDDPLSALDAPTGRWVFEKAILGMLKGKTVVLVTSAVGLVLPCVDNVVVVEQGRVEIQGGVEEVLDRLEMEGESGFGKVVAEMRSVVLAEREKYLKGEMRSEMDEDDVEGGNEVKGATKEGDGKLTDTEKMETGAVTSEVYMLYIKAMGGWLMLGTVLMGYVINHILATSQDVVVSWWALEYRENAPDQNVTLSTLTSSSISSFGFVNILKKSMEEITDKYLIIYSIAAGLCILSIFTRLLLLLLSQYLAALKVHKMLLEKVLRAPLRFFETTPLGRLMNRFSKDVVSVDFEVGTATGNTVFSLVATTVVLGTVAIIVPWLLIPLVPIAMVYIKIGNYYVRTARSLKRLDSILRSPIFSHFGETLTGVVIIRAFGQSHRFMQESIRRFNDSTRASYFLMVSNQWLAIRIQTVGTVVVFVTGLLVLLSNLGPEWAGLVLNLTFTLTDTLMNLVRQQSWMEMAYNSVERCKEYLTIEEEAAEINEDYRPPANWPSEGNVEIRGLEMRYAPHLDPVLKGISASFGASEKVGVVGRTGAGKSTLALSVFRIIEPSAGTIEIDGVDIRKLGLRDLRRGLTIIPQDPVLFTGTVRTNLDPFGTAADADLWEALKRSHLIPPTQNIDGSHSQIDTPGSVLLQRSASSLTLSESEEVTLSDKPRKGPVRLDLDTPISEGGLSLSAGQRQLLCLARALVRPSKLILLDEATASVDSETDNKIQETIRTEFKGSTVLTIAHRLKTIADYDRVICLDKGVIVENGSPWELMQKEGGMFRSMCEESGEWDDLIKLAKGESV
ncbi:hypothetical protein HDV05_008793 [Chytridiales sp. JEL 0842]|nr:hypothetical protein HDV05_008793 [Chytridiales sp. JEL 0842]